MDAESVQYVTSVAVPDLWPLTYLFYLQWRLGCGRSGRRASPIRHIRGSPWHLTYFLYLQWRLDCGRSGRRASPVRHIRGSPWPLTYLLYLQWRLGCGRSGWRASPVRHIRGSPWPLTPDLSPLFIVTARPRGEVDEEPAQYVTSVAVPDLWPIASIYSDG